MRAIFYGVIKSTNRYYRKLRHGVEPCMDWFEKVISFLLGVDFQLCGKDTTKSDHLESSYKILIFIGTSDKR